MNDIFYMNLAIKEAGKAAKINEVPVGAVIVDSENNLIGYGYNNPIISNNPTSHAEINAIGMACRNINNYRLINTSLYVTIEPCIMCMGAIIHARIKRVVFGANDEKWGAVKSLYAMADDTRLNHNPEIVPGICKEKTRQIMQSFFKDKRSK